jgi:hypothetical protein
VKRGRSFMKYRMGSRDANHAAIRDGLRALGHFVVDLAGVGDGVPDLCVYPQHHASAPMLKSAMPVWLEVKTAKGKARTSQLDWKAAAESRGLRVATARTLDEALEALR